MVKLFDAKITTQGGLSIGLSVTPEIIIIIRPSQQTIPLIILAVRNNINELNEAPSQMHAVTSSEYIEQ